MLEMTSDAREGTERVRTIVLGLKAFSRADEERRVALDLPRVLDLSIKMAGNEIRHRARLVMEYGPVPHVVADEARIGQVFINLLVNAAQALRPSPARSRRAKESIPARCPTQRAGARLSCVRSWSDAGTSCSRR